MFKEKKTPEEEAAIMITRWAKSILKKRNT